MMKAAPRRLLLSASLASAALLGSSSCADSPPRRVLLVTIDTMRADRLGAMGSDVATPNLDRLAASGTLFEMAVASAPQTLPSHASIFSGRYPPGHGARNNGMFRLRDDVETLAEVFESAGFRTAAFVGAFVLDRRFGLTQGFDVYDDELPDESPVHKVYFPERRADVIVERAVSWIRAQNEEPFFLWVHVFDPHAPYQPPAPFDEVYRDRLYDGEVAYTDHALGPLLDLVDGMGDALIVVASDHGESLGEHGESTHGLYIYDATLHVPLVMKGPGIPEGKRVKAQVRTVDIAPTLLELTNLRFSSAIDGESLTDLFEGETGASSSPRTAYAESFIPRLNFNWSELRALRTESLKYILAPKPELYDLEADPEESQNLWSGDGGEGGSGRAAVDERLVSELAAMSASDADLTPTVGLDAETARRLESLGYLGSAPRDAAVARERPDPKDRIEVYERMQELLSAELSVEKVIDGYRRILADEPSNAMARNRLANTLSEENRFEEAVVEYRRLVADSEIDFTGLENLASALLLLGRTDEALDVTELAVAEAPWNPDFQTLRGESLEKAQRFDDALAAYDAALELEPSPDSYWRRGALEHKRGDVAPAETDFRAALELDGSFEPAVGALVRLLIESDRAADARVLLDRAGGETDVDSPTMKTARAEIALASGKLEDAKALLEQARAEAPDNSRVLALLGPIYGQEGRLDDAAEVLEKALALGETASEIRRNLALIYVRKREPRRAVEVLRAAIESSPDDATLWYTLGNVLFQAGGHEPAVEAFSRALDLRPRWPEAAFNLGMAADNAGHGEEAAKAFRLYLDTGDPSDSQRRAEAQRRLARLTGGP